MMQEVNTKESQPLYEQIREAVADGELPESFSLKKPEKQGNQLRFVDGGWDGIVMYHMSSGEQDVGELCKVLTKCVEGKPKEAMRLLEDFFNPEERRAMLHYIDNMQQWVIENQENLDINCLYTFSMELITQSCNPECVKFGLSFLELLTVETDEEICDIVRTLGLSDEFTLYSMYILRKREDGNEQLFRLARKVHGWGRVFLVEELKPDTEEIRKWLLEDGWRNEVMADYSALPCAQKGGLAQLLEQPSLTGREYEIARDLIGALLPEGPAAGLSGMENKESLIERYLVLCLSMAQTITDFTTVEQVKQYLENAEWEDKEKLLSQCTAILDSDKCLDTVRRAVEEGEGYELAKHLGLDYAKAVFDKITEDFEKSYHLIDLLMPDGIYLDELIALFGSRLPLKEMATGPADEMGLGQEWKQFSILCYMLQFLKPFPGKGEELVLCGLNAPVINNRNMALNVLEAWKEKGADLSEEICRAVKKLKNSEVDEKVKERLSGF